MANLIKLGVGSVELSGDASDNEVLYGRKYYSDDPSVKRTGNMPAIGNWGATLNPGESVNVPWGCHSGGGVVVANKQNVGGCYITASGEVVWNQTSERNINLMLTATKYATYRITAEIYGISGHMHGYQTNASGTKKIDKTENVGGYLSTKITRVFEGVVTNTTEQIKINQQIYTSSSQMQANIKIEINPK